MIEYKDIEGLVDSLSDQEQKADHVTQLLEVQDPLIKLPSKVGPEKRFLADLTRVPWLRTVVTATSRNLRISDITSHGKRCDFAYEWMMKNDLLGQQEAAFDWALAYGQAFVVTTPAVFGTMPRTRFVDSTRMVVYFEDPSDVFPAKALEKAGSEDRNQLYRLYTPGLIQTLEVSEGKVTVTKTVETGLDVVNVTRMANKVDLTGKVTGEVLPYEHIAERIAKTEQDRFHIQHSNSFKSRYVVGVNPPRLEPSPDMHPDAFYGEDMPVDEEKLEKMEIEYSNTDFFFLRDADAKVGTLDETDLRPLLAAHESDLATLAAVTHTPIESFSGQMVNLSAEALEASRMAFYQKIDEKQRQFGNGILSALRIAAAMAGENAIAEDPYLAVQWHEAEIITPAQAADAIQKLIASGVPEQEAWKIWPKLSAEQHQAWVEAADEKKRLEFEQSPANRAALALERQYTHLQPAIDESED